MHDTLVYMRRDPIHRQYHHDDMTFGLLYAFTENFILPLSHDEVVYGKRSLIGKMPGDRWQRFANLRAYFGFMWGHPGKKLLFMGGEFAQEREWNHDLELDWQLVDEPMHAGVQRARPRSQSALFVRARSVFARQPRRMGFSGRSATISPIRCLRFCARRKPGAGARHFQYDAGRASWLSHWRPARRRLA